jgi:dTDP-4-dehydrorhamnose reductase
MDILVIGKNGQLAQELANLGSIHCTCLGREQIDLFDTASLLNTIKKGRYDVVINTSAYTSVDLAETNEDEAHKLNVNAAENLANACKQLGLYFIHISTDFVFSGNQSRPYKAADKVGPIGIYGRTKAEGEERVTRLYAENSAIVRTSWLYSTYANNFVKTMLRLMASKSELKVVGDQVGTPTYTNGLAKAIIQLARNKHKGIYHWTDSGVASWYDFAVAIQELAYDKGLLSHKIPIYSITTEQYPTPAQRPCYSVLDKSKILKACPELDFVHWRESLNLMLGELLGKQGA